jgi:hypothetical protein
MRKRPGATGGLAVGSGMTAGGEGRIIRHARDGEVAILCRAHFHSRI